MSNKSDLLYVMYMGGPDCLEAIEPFLYNLFNDRNIIDFGIGELPQRLLAKFIAKKRSKKVAKEYEKMGGASPQLPIMNSLLKKVSMFYHERYGRHLETAVGMCYYHPYIKDTIKYLQTGDFDNIYVMTMYPQYSYTTAGACFSRFFNAINILPPKKSFKVIPHWHLNRSYNSILIRNILESIKELNITTDQAHILFSAHSLPYYTIDKGDLYVKHITEQIHFIIDQIKPRSFSLSYQSKTGKIRWLEPSTEDEINRLIKERYNNIVICPISFVSDHIETLIEVDDQYLSKLKANGIKANRSKSLNDDDDFAKALIDILVE
ncbi:MAG: ferrochelatase [Calditerrivibrio sp.]|nr:ferrochelatase [Calditerrivibrio sp.]